MAKIWENGDALNFLTYRGPGPSLFQPLLFEQPLWSKPCVYS